METRELSDKSIVPDDAVVFAIIGENRFRWLRLMQVMHERYPDAQEIWKYYHDGKRWLFRMLRKKKTLFWIGLLKDTFRITFYLGDKAESLIEKSDLPEVLKSEFNNGRHFGKFRALSITVSCDEDIDHAIRICEIGVMIK
jgi:hypothetical protein